MIERLLHKLEHFHPVTPEEAEGLRSVLTPPRPFKRGETLIRQFSRPHQSTLILSGLAGRLVTLAEGAEQLTAVHIAGDFVDLHGFVMCSLDHSVTALTDGAMTSAPHGPLEALTDRFPRLTRALWFLTMVDAAIHRQWIAVIARRDAAGRMAHLFCELWTRLDDVALADGRSFALPLRQSDLANALGISKVHVNRVLQDLRSRGLIHWRQGRVEIRDWAGLTELAEFDATYLQLPPVAAR